MSKQKVNSYIIPEHLSQSQRIRYSLEVLNLEGILTSYDKVSGGVLSVQGTLYDYLEKLLEHQMQWKEEKRINSWVQQAKFPQRKTIEDFDFSYQPSIDKRKINEFISLRFIEQARNIVFLGQSGVGKTHLAIAIGERAIYAGFDVRFIELSELISKITEKNGEATKLRVLFSSLERPQLLILDEIRGQEVNQTTRDFLYRLIRRRYERGSIILTSNQPYSQWESLFGNDAGPIIERILHHAEIVKIEGESYRLKERKKKNG